MGDAQGTTDTANAKTAVPPDATAPVAVSGTPTRALEDKDAAAKADAKDPPTLAAPNHVVAGTNGVSTLSPRIVDLGWLNVDLDARLLKKAAPIGNSKAVKLYGFRVLGNTFDPGSGSGAPGVNRFLAEKLVTLQKNLYALAKAEAGKDVTETEFLDWLWNGKQSAAAGSESWQLQSGEQILYVPPSGLLVHKGCHNLGGSDYHSPGSAVDLNYERNPWAPMSLPGRAVGDYPGAWAPQQIWEPCFDVYDRATGLIAGQSKRAITLPGAPPDDLLTRANSDPQAAVKEFRRLSNCVRKYFQLAFDPVKGVSTWGAVRVANGLVDFDRFRSNLQKLGAIDTRPDPTHLGSGSGLGADPLRRAESC